MFLNSGQYYNSAALYGGGEDEEVEMDDDYEDDVDDEYTGEYFGGFKPVEKISSDRAELAALGMDLYTSKNIGLTNRNKLSLEYAVQNGKTTAGHVYLAIGALYTLDSCKRTIMLTKSSQTRSEMQDAIYKVHKALPPFGKGGDPQWTVAWTKVNKIMHPKLRPPKKVRKYIRDPDAQWKRGNWAKFLRKVPALSPERRQDMRAKFKANPAALSAWKTFYGPKGNHRVATGNLASVVQAVASSAPPAPVPSAPLPAPGAAAAPAAAPAPAASSTVLQLSPQDIVVPKGLNGNTLLTLVNAYLATPPNTYSTKQIVEMNMGDAPPQIKGRYTAAMNNILADLQHRLQQQASSGMS